MWLLASSTAASASRNRARATVLSDCVTSTARRFSAASIPMSAACTLLFISSTSNIEAACLSASRRSEAYSFWSWSFATRRRAKSLSMVVNSSCLPPASRVAKSALACATRASAASRSACRPVSLRMANGAPWLTVCPSCTGTLLTSPACSTRTACHSIGSTLPLVGSVLTSVSRMTLAKGTCGASLFRWEAHQPTAASGIANSHSSFFTTTILTLRDYPSSCGQAPSLRRALRPPPGLTSWPVEAAMVRIALSARNQLRSQIADVKLGTVMAHIVVQVGENEVESVIARRSAEEMNLKTGDSVTVVIKSTEVMIQKYRCTGSVRSPDPKRTHLPNPPCGALLTRRHQLKRAVLVPQRLPVSHRHQVHRSVPEPRVQFRPGEYRPVAFLGLHKYAVRRRGRVAPHAIRAGYYLHLAGWHSEIGHRNGGARSADAVDNHRPLNFNEGGTRNGQDDIPGFELLVGSNVNRLHNRGEPRAFNVQFVRLPRFGWK